MIYQEVLCHFFLLGVVQSPLRGADEICDMDIGTLHTKELLHKPGGWRPRLGCVCA